MQRIHEEQPRPILMFVDESDSESIRAAVRAGVSAYVVDGVKSRSVRPIVEVAIARFREFQALRGELESARASLVDRKLIERAKGILMSRHRMSEDEAYHRLRRAAMERNVGDDGARPKVACPQHKKTFDLERGDGLSDPERRIATYAARAENGMVYAKLPASWPEPEGAESCGARCGG